MKKLIFSAAMLAIAFSCNNPSTTATTGNEQTTREENNLAINRKVYTAIESGNTSSLDTLIAADAVDHDGPGGMELKGKDSILHMLGDMHNHFNNLKFDVISSAANGDYVFTLIRFSGTTTDSIMGMPGQNMDQKGVDVVKLNNDNKITEHWGFTEDQQVAKQMMEMSGKMNRPDDSKMKK